VHNIQLSTPQALHNNPNANEFTNVQDALAIKVW